MTLADVFLTGTSLAVFGSNNVKDKNGTFIAPTRRPTEFIQTALNETSHLAEQYVNSTKEGFEHYVNSTKEGFDKVRNGVGKGYNEFTKAMDTLVLVVEIFVLIVVLCAIFFVIYRIYGVICCCYKCTKKIRGTKPKPDNAV